MESNGNGTDKKEVPEINVVQQSPFKFLLTYNAPEPGQATRLHFELDLDSLMDDPNASKFVRGLAEEIKIEILSVMQLKYNERSKSKILRVH